MSNVERTEHELALLAWAESVVPSDYVVIFENADGPRPPTRYVTLLVPTMPLTGTGDNRVLDEVFEGKCKGDLQVHYEATCSVNVFGANASDVIEDLRISIDLPDVLESTGDAGLSIVGSTASLNVTELAGTRSVPRYQSDFFFHWSKVTHYAADVIETVNMPET